MNFIGLYLFARNSVWGESKAPFFVSSSPFWWNHFHHVLTFWKWPFSPYLVQPPPREYIFRRSFPRVSRTLSRWFLPPQTSHNHHLHDSHAVALFSTWIFDNCMFVLLLLSLVRLCLWIGDYCHAMLLAHCYHELLVSITFILPCLIVVHVGSVMFFDAWLASVTEYC